MKFEISRNMFYGAKPQIFENARQLRQSMTEAEKILWQELKGNKLGVRFKPQHPVNIFILDFYCHKLKLGLEIDGEIHHYKTEYDNGRTFELNNLGITILRFTNDQVLNDLITVIGLIKARVTFMSEMDID